MAKCRPRISISVLLIGSFFVLHCCNGAETPIPHYKMCVPQHILESCEKIVNDGSSEKVRIECVPARDRMACLKMVNRREADFVAVDPEDMYVAHRLQNEDFSVFSEIRTNEEPDAEFRYEGVILIHRNSNIHSLSDLKGKKSCHTGYGRNVGYKIPITKLKKAGVLKVADNPALSPVEKELKGLSDLFQASCLVGTYSANEEVNAILKKRYSNLCALCQDPVKCNYPDKYSGYDGAIRCLVENGGDVAFTKTIYVRRFFGLPIANNPSKTTAEASPADYEYLCEDGSRRPVTGPACSWAQRPWQGYMGNSDVNTRLTRLQNRIESFYNNGKRSDDPKAAADMWIKDTNLVVKKEHEVYPGEHLIRAKYKEVIERDGSVHQKIRLCVGDDVEVRKCNTLKQAAYSRDIRPEFECIQSDDCLKNVENGHSDACLVDSKNVAQAEKLNLKPILFEEFNTNDNYVAVGAKTVDVPTALKSGIDFDKNDQRSIDAALYFYHKYSSPICPDKLLPQSSGAAAIKICRSNQLNQEQFNGMELLCPNGSRKPLTAIGECNFDATVGRNVFVRADVSGAEYENILHGFTSLSDNFGHNAKNENVFEMFGLYEPNQPNVIFSDAAARLVSRSNDIGPEFDTQLYNRLHCLN